MTNDYPVLMFLALVALFSPLAALSAIMPVIERYSPADQVRLAVGLFFNVVIFVLAAVWVGEPLLNLLGLSTAALTITGGIALLYAGVPMMRGIAEAGADAPAGPDEGGEPGEGWREVLFTPLTFPLTVGGTSFGMIVAFASNGVTLVDGLFFSVAGIFYAAVAGLTVYFAGHVNRRVSPRSRMVLSRIAGILLTAIAVSLLVDGGTRMIFDALVLLRNA